MKKVLILMSIGAVASAHATITAIGPFAGSMSESFEGFQNYINNPNFYEPEPFAIMGGGAMVTSNTQDMVIYDPNAATFGLASSGNAQVHDGVQGLGMNSGPDFYTISFTNAQTSFGGWFGLATFGGGGTANVDFYDAAGGLVGSTSFTYNHESNADGMLDWNGWSSDIAFSSIKLSGDYIVADSLQAGAVPEPATLSVLGLGAAALLRRRARKS